MAKKKDELAPAIQQADKLLAVVTGKQFAAVEKLGDAEFDQMFRLGVKALFLQAVSKSQQAMASITQVDLAESSGAQKAVIAGILADKAEKLAQLVDVREQEQGSIGVDDFRQLVQSIRGRVTKLSALGVELTVENPMREHDTGFGAEESGAVGGLVEVPDVSHAEAPEGD